jgi:pimeloyl-ACP methyl ester carboxylesterase
MRRVCWLRDKLVLIVIAGCAICLAPAAFAWNTPRFDPIQCPIDVLPKQLANAHCGYLTVPEDRSQQSGRTIQLFVAIIPAQSGKPASDPVVYLGSGPGGIVSTEIAPEIDAGINRDHDLIIMNQRGQFLSIPALTCLPIDEFDRELLGLRFYSPQTKRKHVRATADCRDELQATGANLPSYNSTENAADFADLRTALGISQWNVFGLSYGTDLAQQYVRDHPEGIRSVVLDSVIPVTITLAKYWESTRAGLDNLFQACVAQAACNTAHPNLEANVTNLVNMLKAAPLTTATPDPVTGEPVTVVVDGGSLLDWIRDQGRTNTMLTRVPAVIDELAQGNPKALTAIAMYKVQLSVVPAPGTPAVSYGLGAAVICREQFVPDEDIGAAGRQAFPLYPASIQNQLPGTWAYTNDDCARVWKFPLAPAEVRQPLMSSIPTLLISGSFDTVASLDFAQSVAAGLSKATLISIPGIGHSVMPSSPCAQQVFTSFLSNPSNPDTSCVGPLKPPPFTAFEPENAPPTVPAIE